MKNSEYIDQLLARRFSGETLTSAQETELQEWIRDNRSEYDTIQRLFEEGFDGMKIPEFDAQKGWKKVEPQLTETSPVKAFTARFIGIAASVAILTGISLFWFFRQDRFHTDYRNMTAANEQVILPDLSEVTLFPGASLEYNGGQKRGNRMVTLHGKAFFEVARNEKRPFIVDAGKTEVKVLGTSFLVNAINNDSTEVKVKTGKVSVENNNRDMILTAGEEVCVSPQGMVKNIISNPDAAFGKMPAELKFDNTPLPDVIRTLEQVYGITVEADPQLERNTITTTVSTDNPDEILTEISWLTGSKVQKISDKYYKLYRD